MKLNFIGVELKNAIQTKQANALFVTEN